MRNPPADACRCAVPGCQRWTRKVRPPIEWICGTHWRAIPLWIRQRDRRMIKALERRGEVDALAKVCLSRRAARMNRRSWRVLVKHAITEAAGI